MKRACLFLVFASLTIVSVGSAEYPGEVLSAWAREYQELDRGIKSRPAEDNPAASALLDKNCKILAGDKSPAGVVIRRTGALIAHLKTLQGAAGLADFQSKLDALKKKSSPGKEFYTEACKLRRAVEG